MPGFVSLDDYEPEPLGVGSEEERRRARLRPEVDRVLDGYSLDALEALQAPPAGEIPPPVAPPVREEPPARSSGPMPGRVRPQGSSMTTYPAGDMSFLPPRAQAIEQRLRDGDAAGVERDVITPPARVPVRRPSVAGNVAGSPVSPMLSQRDEAFDEEGAFAPRGKAPTETKTTQGPRMDDGLPTDRDIGDARTRDDIRRPFRAIGSALAAYGGLPASPRGESEADALTRRRQEGLATRGGEKRAARAGEAAEAAQALQTRRLALGEAQQSERARAAMSREEREARIAEARTALMEAQTGREAQTARQRLDALRPESDASARARARYVISAMDRERLRPERERRTREDIAREVATMAAVDIEALESELPGVTMGSRTSRAGAGGTGPRGPGLSPADRRAGLLRQADDRNIPRGVSETLDDEALARMLAQDSLTRGPQQQAQEYGERLAMSGLGQADEALRAVEQFLEQHGGDIPGQGPVDTMGGLRPQWTQGADAREFQRRSRRLLDSELRQATGANAPLSEVQTFAQILGLSETSSDEDVRAAMGQARDYLNSQYNALRGSYDPEAIATWERRARASQGRGTQAQVREPASAPAAAPTSGGRAGQTRMVNPQGRTGWLPDSQVDAAIAAGWSRADAR